MRDLIAFIAALACIGCVATAPTKAPQVNLLQIVDQEGNVLTLQSIVGTCQSGWRRAIHSTRNGVPLLGCYRFLQGGDLVVDYEDGTRHTVPAAALREGGQRHHQAALETLA